MDITEIIVILCACHFSSAGRTKFIDEGNPYHNGPLHVSEMVLTKTMQNSPIHTLVFYPVEQGIYPAIIFAGGLYTIIPSENYQTLMSKIASHGFFVFGIDYFYPGYSTQQSGGKELKDIEDDIFDFIQWMKHYMKNRTLSAVDWNKIGLLCHSAGCDTTLLMSLKNHSAFSATVFLEPFSFHANKNITFQIPSLMYGTQLSQDGIIPCSVKGLDWNHFYDIWTCPKIKIELANFGHCDILDPVGWEACHLSKACKTTNSTHLTTYRQFVQGVASTMFITFLQGRQQTLKYITDSSNISLPTLQHAIDISCLNSQKQ